MQDIPVRLLAQVPDKDEDPRPDRVVLLFQRSALEEMLKQLDANPEKPQSRGVHVQKFGMNIILEVFDPSKTKRDDLVYVECLKEEGFVTTQVTTL